MYKYGTLTLHQPEEDVTVATDGMLRPLPPQNVVNPITDYFSVANGLASKLTQPPYDTDAEVLGLLVLGVVSAAEFYFRSVLGVALNICAVSRHKAETLQVPFAAHEFFKNSGYSYAMGAIDHESLADAKKIRSECKKFTGFDLSEDSSADKAIQDFEIVCEVRHCLVHARGVAGIKACRTLAPGEHSPQKLLISKVQAFELLKLSHNAVRAFNRFLANSIVNRWIDHDVLSGEWAADKPAFVTLQQVFSLKGEDAYGGVPWKAYLPLRAAVRARKAAMAAKVTAPAV